MMMNIEVIKGFAIDLPILVFHSTTLILNSLTESVLLHYTVIDLFFIILSKAAKYWGSESINLHT